jgi:hypothetical protein
MEGNERACGEQKGLVYIMKLSQPVVVGSWNIMQYLLTIDPACVTSKSWTCLWCMGTKEHRLESIRSSHVSFDSREQTDHWHAIPRDMQVRLPTYLLNDGPSLVNITEANSSPIASNSSISTLLLRSSKLLVLANMHKAKKQSNKCDHNTHSSICGAPRRIVRIIARC